MLLLTTIVGLGIVVALQWREIEPLRREVRELRGEVGQLTVDDPAKAYAIGLPTMEDNYWRWRVYLPPGVEYRTFVYSGHFPKRTSPLRQWLGNVVDDGAGMSSSGSDFQGEFIIECRAYEKDGQWTMQTKYTRRSANATISGGGGTTINQPDNWFADGRGRITATDVATLAQEVFESDEPILLLHVERQVIKELPGGGYTSQSATGPADGVAVWLAPSPPETRPVSE
jgi:hypothetical protein